MTMTDSDAHDSPAEKGTNSVLQMRADFTQPHPRVRVRGRYYDVTPGDGLSIRGCPQEIEHIFEEMEKSQ